MFFRRGIQGSERCAWYDDRVRFTKSVSHSRVAHDLIRNRLMMWPGVAAWIDGVWLSG